MRVHDPQPDKPPRSVAEAVAAILRLQPDGPGRWRGACLICGTPDAFRLVEVGRSCRWRCTTCGRDKAVTLAMRRTITRERQREAGR